MPAGHYVMVDLGSTKNKEIVKKSLFSYIAKHTAFKDPGQWLAWLVLTHGDRDHYNLVEDFLTTFGVNVRNVLHGGLESEYDGLIGRLRARSNSDGTTPTILTKTGTLFMDLDPAGAMGAGFTALAIGVEAAGGNVGYVKNTRSVVLRIVYQGASLMLTGDATRDTEQAIISHLKKLHRHPSELRSDVLKVAHHGSHRTSNMAQWLMAVDPSLAFFTSDRSGTLDEATKRRTGHRLPQMLTVDLLRSCSTRLRKNREAHSYVSSYEETDYLQYQLWPDKDGPKLPLPLTLNKVEWVQTSGTREGIYSTLAVMGTSDDPDDEGANDLGAQYRVTVADNGQIDVESTLN
jgi:Metallo-beta-lactamase superfamily